MKRLMDITFAAVILLFASPALGVVLLSIWLQDRNSPFYLAPRVGKDARPFKMVKLRSMVINADVTGVNSTSMNDARITTIGRFIRATKLDELTQLWNVLRGDVSLVGPRPNTWAWGVELYTEEERRLLSARPGITDLSSIVFADEGAILKDTDEPDIAYNQLIRPWKSRLGLFYIGNASLRLDLEIVALTVAGLFSRQTALDGVAHILDRLAAPEDLKRIARRDEELLPAPPPGSNSIVTGRLIGS